MKKKVKSVKKLNRAGIANYFSVRRLFAILSGEIASGLSPDKLAYLRRIASQYGFDFSNTVVAPVVRMASEWTKVCLQQGDKCVFVHLAFAKFPRLWCAS